MNRVVLSKEEGEWFARNVLKSLVILDTAATKDTKIKDRTTYKILESVKERATEMESVLKQIGSEPFEFELMLSQKQKRVIQDLIDRTRKALTERILPEYQRRGLSDYVEDTEFKVDLLGTMRRKFK